MRSLPAPVLAVPGNHDVGEAGNPHQPVNAERLDRWRRHFGPDWWVARHRELAADRPRLDAVRQRRATTSARSPNGCSKRCAEAGGRRIALVHAPAAVHREPGRRRHRLLVGEARAARATLLDLVRRHDVALVAHRPPAQVARYVASTAALCLVRRRPGFWSAPQNQPDMPGEKRARRRRLRIRRLGRHRQHSRSPGLDDALDRRRAARGLSAASRGADAGVRRAIAAMASVELESIGKSFGGVPVLSRHRPRRRGRRVPDAGRPVGLRQVDADPHHRRPGAADRRARCDRRRAGRPSAAARAARRDGVPELCALSAHDACSRTSRCRSSCRGCNSARAPAAAAACCRRAGAQRHGRASSAKCTPSRSSCRSRQLLDRRPSQLSGGQRQRVALGRAMVRQPAAFLMDEPLSNLDAKLRVHMRSELAELHARLGATFIYVTHDQVEAMTMSDRVAMMDDGEILQLGTPERALCAPGERQGRAVHRQPGDQSAAGQGRRRRTRRAVRPELPMSRRGRRPGPALTLGIRPEAMTPAPRRHVAPGHARARRPAAPQRESRRGTYPACRSRRAGDDGIVTCALARRAGSAAERRRRGRAALRRRLRATCSTPKGSASATPSASAAPARRARRRLTRALHDERGRHRRVPRTVARRNRAAVDREPRRLGFAFPAFLLLLLTNLVPLLVLLLPELHRLRARRARHRTCSASTISQGAGRSGLPALARQHVRSMSRSSLPGAVGLGLLIAVLVHRRKRTRSFYEVIYFLPVTSTLIAMATVWQFLLHPRLGPINGVLRAIGLRARSRS